MAGRCWKPAVVLLLLSAGTGLAALDQNQLADIVTTLLNRYQPSFILPSGSRSFPMFSLAVSIPFNKATGKYDVSQITDSKDQVREEILKCKVYTSNRMVAATVLRWPNVLTQCPNETVQWSHVIRSCREHVKTWDDVNRLCPSAVEEGRADHAEYRTVQKLQALLSTSAKEDLLIFYVLASPCANKCANESSRWNILTKINLILNWTDYAFVFSNVFKPRNGNVIPEDNLRKALETLGTYKLRNRSIGLNNLFRCNKRRNRSLMTCTSCSAGGEVASYCVSDKSQ